MHDLNGLPNPTATAIVGAALERIIEDKPPRSWPKGDQAVWALLPAQLRNRITTRELQRDNVRRCQNELAELKQKQKGNDQCQNSPLPEAPAPIAAVP